VGLIKLPIFPKLRLSLLKDPIYLSVWSLELVVALLLLLLVKVLHRRHFLLLLLLLVRLYSVRIMFV
jgi:hypothetical protein